MVFEERSLEFSKLVSGGFWGKRRGGGKFLITTKMDETLLQAKDVIYFIKWVFTKNKGTYLLREEFVWWLVDCICSFSSSGFESHSFTYLAQESTSVTGIFQVCSSRGLAILVLPTPISLLSPCQQGHSLKEIAPLLERFAGRRTLSGVIFFFLFLGWYHDNSGILHNARCS